MVSFLFWNIRGKRRDERVARLVAHHDVDILLLAECVVDTSTLLATINTAKGGRFLRQGIVESKVQVFSRRADIRFTQKFVDVLGRISIFKLSSMGFPEILLVAVHLPSRRDRSVADNSQSATNWARRIREIEQEQSHRHTILVGDLNMNPFEEGVVSGHGFHAVMTKSKALELERSVDGELSPFFYNPMWGFFGDRTLGPPGTYYRSASEPINYFWNMYDQVLIRPDLLPYFADVRILDHDGRESLLTSGGKPHRARCSDHLPLLFKIERK
jgi:exonuclease III